MIGVLPVAALAPLEYRFALDAAVSITGGATAPLVLCNVADLEDEVHQRTHRLTDPSNAAVGLWIEPLAHTWRDDLGFFAATLPAEAPLIVIVSRPLARLLPERRCWRQEALGFRLGGVNRLRRALRIAGFIAEATHAIHSDRSIILNLMGEAISRFGRPDLGDRLHFAARLRYCRPGTLAALSTVALLVARKGPD